MTVLLLLITKLAEYFAYGYAVLLVIGIAMVIWLIAKDENPAYKLAWVVPITLFPIFGGVLYIIFGNKNMPRSVILKLKKIMRMTDRRKASSTAFSELREQDERYANISAFITKTTGCEVWKNTQAEYFPLGEQMWASMLVELEKAQEFIFMEFFIVEEGEMWAPIYEILCRKAKQGVDIRFMYDDMGSLTTVTPKFKQRLKEAGIQCIVFNPVKPHLNSMLNYRDHRKIIVIDGKVGYCGGINIADEYINKYEKHGHWKDTGVLLRGSAVYNLTEMFLSLWNFSDPETPDSNLQMERFFPADNCNPGDGYIQAFGDTPLDNINTSEDTYMQIINRANRYVYIATPYLILDNEMVTALQIAARSGVDVRILVPHIPDKWFVHETTQSFYQTLLDAGVHIYEYTPGFIHAKMYVSDDNIAIVGTANMDFRSFYLHFECGVCFYYSSVVEKVRDDFLETLKVSQKIPKNYKRTVPLHKRMLRAFLRMFAPMM